MSQRLKGALSTIGIRGSPEPQKQKLKKSPEPGDDQPVTVGVMRHAVQASMEASLTAFADAVGNSLDELGERTSANTEKIDIHTTEIDDLKKSIEDLRNQHMTHDTRIDVVEAIQVTQKQTQSSGAQSQRSQAGSSPWETNWAVIGNLGWDLSAPQLLERARQILSEARVDSAKYDLLSAMKTPGSACSLRFESPEVLQDVRKKVYHLEKAFRQDGKCVWLDRQKSSSELRPGRQLNRAHGLVEEFLTGKGSTAQATKDHRGIKRLMISSVVVASIGRQGLVWKADAAAHIDKETQEEITFAVEMIQ